LAVLADYAYIYNLSAQVVAVESAVSFDTNGVSTAGITHIPGTAQVLVVLGGVYSVDFSVSGVEPNQFALFQNGAPAAGGIYGSGAGTQQTSGTVILVTLPGDVITLVNHSSAAAVTLQTLAGGTQINVNASLKFMRIA